MQSPYRLRNAIFDLDGTLVDSARDIRSAIARACAAVGIEAPAGKIETLVIGPPLRAMLAELIPDLGEQLGAALAAAFRQAYDTSPHAETNVYAGVWEVLRELRDSNATLLLATNKPALATRRVLAKTGLQACLRDVVTPDALPGGKASKTEMVRHLIEKWTLERASTFFFGDAVSDIEAAQQNGIGSVAVLSGYGKREELMNCQPSVLLESIGGLLHCGQFNFR
jgi:phosphoglycolate phosphatase